MSAPHHSQCRGGLCCFSPVTSSWPLARCHNPNSASRHLLTHARPAHGSGGCSVPQAPSLCQAGYGCLLSNSGRGWQLKPGGTLSAFPLQHPHRARLSCTRPSPAAPVPTAALEPGGTRPRTPCQGTRRAGALLARGTGKTPAHSTQAVAGKEGKPPGSQLKEEGVLGSVR